VATVTPDAAGPSSAGTAFTATSGSWTHVNGGNGILVGCTVFTGSSDTITAVSYGGVALTHLGYIGPNGAGGVSFWGLAGPSCPTGSNTVQVTKTGTSNCNAGSVSVAGAGSFGSLFSAQNGGSATSQAITVTGTTAGGLIVSVAAWGGGGTSSVSSPATQQWSHPNSSSSGADGGGGATCPSPGGGASQTITWTETAADEWYVLAVEVLPPAPSGPGGVTQDPSTPAAVDATGSVSATVVTASFSPPAGSLAVVTVNIGFAATQATAPNVSVADSAGNTYTPGPGVYDGVFDGTWHFTWYYAAAPGAVTVTATRDQTAAALYELYPRVLAGAATSQAAAAAAAASSGTPITTGSLAGGTITPAAAGSLLVVGACIGATENAWLPAGGVGTDLTHQDTTDGIQSFNGHLIAGPHPAAPGWKPLSNAAEYSWAALEVLAAAPPSIPVIQAVTAPNATTVTLPYPTRAGSALIIGISLADGVNAPPSVTGVTTDTGTAALAIAETTVTNTAQNGYYAAIWWVADCPAGTTTVTIATTAGLSNSTGFSVVEAPVTLLDGTSAGAASANAWNSGDAAMSWPAELVVGVIGGGFGNGSYSFLTGATAHPATGLLLLNQSAEGTAYLITGTGDGATAQFKGAITGASSYNTDCVVATFAAPAFPAAAADLHDTGQGSWVSPGAATADDGAAATWAVT
jgi:hypothetical protein